MEPIMALTLYTHPKLEVLADHLAQAFQHAPLADPFAPEWVLIPHAGVKAWLDPLLARKLGIWTRAWLLYPRAALWHLVHLALPDLPREPQLAPEESAWLMLQYLPQWLSEPEFAPVRQYLNAAPQPEINSGQGWQLLRHLAQYFDRYGLYRPEWLEAWEAGDTPHWQARLWQRLVAQRFDKQGLPKGHRQALKNHFMALLKGPKAPLKRLPTRLNLFGVSQLPDFYFDMLSALSRHLEVNLWLPLPVPAPECLVQLLAQPVTHPPTSLHPLLKQNAHSLGYFVRQCLQAGAQVRPLTSDTEHSQPLPANSEPSRLKQLQHGLWQGCDNRSPAPPQTGHTGPDLSLQIHACHSPQREVEVLYNHLLHLFKVWPELQPGEIGVLVPELESYTPLIAAVFGNRRPPLPYLPHRIIAPQQGNTPSVQAFRTLLELSNSRLSLPEVLGLLEQEVIYTAFHFQTAELERCRQWLEAVQVRWGLDAQQRQRLDLPAFEAHTWRRGLQRLLLGYAGQGERPFAGLLPYAEIEGSSARTLGHLLDFFDSLEKGLRLLSQTHSLPTWAELLQELAQRFIRPPRERLEELFALQEDVGQALEQIPPHSVEAVPLSLIRPALEARWQRPVDRLVLSGVISFGTPATLRGLPFRVLCLLGLNAGVLPRREAENDLDLLLSAPRPGDPSQREDDRALFLDCLGAVRDSLYLSYLGRRIRDNREMPPSILISELKEALQSQHQERLETVFHPLQAFDSSYFDGQHPALQAYDPEAFKSAQARLRAQHQPRQSIFVDRALPPVSSVSSGSAGERDWLDWQEIQRFFQHPARTYLQARLNLSLRQQVLEEADAEPFQLNGLARYQLRQDYLEQILQGRSEAEFTAWLQAADRLPPGPAGAWELDKVFQEVRPLAQALQVWLPAHERSESHFHLKLPAGELHGLLGPLYRPGWVRLHPASLKPADYLQAWLNQLLLACLGQEAPVQQFYLLALEPGSRQALVLDFEPPPEPRAELGRYLQIYWQGLERPLPFASRSSWAWQESLLKDGPTKAESKARQQWESSAYFSGEDSDPAYQLCLEDDWYLQTEATELAQAVYGPILEQLQQHQRLRPLPEVLATSAQEADLVN